MKKIWKILVAGGIAGYGAHLGMEAFAENMIEKLFRSNRDFENEKVADFFPTSELQKQYDNELEEHIEWFRKSVKKELTITSLDGLKLSGIWLIENRNNPTILLSHGESSDRYFLLKQAFEFYKKGYNTLLIDHRGYGSSEGEYTTFGLKEGLDICQWIECLLIEDSSMIIGLYGVGSGANAIMMALGTKMVDNVKFAVVEGGFLSLRERITAFLPQSLHRWNLLMKYFNQAILKKFSFRMEDIDVRKSLQNNTVPTCFIHAENDELISSKESKTIYHHNLGKKYYYPVKGAYHSYACYDEGYFQCLNSFIQTCLTK